VVVPLDIGVVLVPFDDGVVLVPFDDGVVLVPFDDGVLLVPFDGTAVLLVVGTALLVGFKVDAVVVLPLLIGGTVVVLVLPVTVSGRGFNITHGELTSN